ncbi:hypothetical protein [uncultured Tolumonas sp.]|uniref:hypothetical protein n=1 Tax=uncultured Tolumonas sp. TaxID=263765 RepID=UPI00292F0333|nr:hypothetical protein [uncultured Tolumonas sp.]
MYDLCLGALLVFSAMALIFFGPELGKVVGRKFLHSRHRIRRARLASRRMMRLRPRRYQAQDSFAHS